MRFIKAHCVIVIGVILGLGGSASASEPVLLSVSSSQNPVSLGKSVDITATLRSIWRAPFGELQFEGLGVTSYDTQIRTAPDEFSITAGFSHSCALTHNGTAQCWGDNATYGQLGNGTSVNATSPYAVSGLGAENRAIVAGSASTCVLTVAGGVKCFGSNTFGELGQGTGTGWPSTGSGECLGIDLRGSPDCRRWQPFLRGEIRRQPCLLGSQHPWTARKCIADGFRRTGGGQRIAKRCRPGCAWRQSLLRPVVDG